MLILQHLLGKKLTLAGWSPRSSNSHTQFEINNSLWNENKEMRWGNICWTSNSRTTNTQNRTNLNHVEMTAKRSLVSDRFRWNNVKRGATQKNLTISSHSPPSCLLLIMLSCQIKFRTMFMAMLSRIKKLDSWSSVTRWLVALCELSETSLD